VFSPIIFWPCFAGLVVLLIGLFAARKEFSAAIGVDKIAAWAGVFYAAPLAVFGAEHLVAGQAISQGVPPWMPGRLYWAYFVGIALIFGALSIVLTMQVRLTGTLLGIMFILFVLMIHVPNVAANPKNRIFWALVFRDLCFAGGGWCLAGRIAIGRFCIGIPLLVFAAEHFLHPEFVPGVPLGKMIPAWVPYPPAIGYLTGVALLAAGVLILIDKHTRTAAIWLGLLITLEVLFLYLPILIMASGSGPLTEGENYVADTLLFGGTILLLAGTDVVRRASKKA
jgi:uncharacterized membrane protein